MGLPKINGNLVISDNGTDLKTLKELCDDFCYSLSEERETGEYWVNNKKLYSKSFWFNLSSHNFDIDVSSLNIDTGFFDMTHSYYHDTTNGRYYPLVITQVAASSQQYAYANSQACVYYKNDKKTIRCETGQSINGNIYITIEYTKK